MKQLFAESLYECSLKQCIVVTVYINYASVTKIRSSDKCSAAYIIGINIITTILLYASRFNADDTK